MSVVSISTAIGNLMNDYNTKRDAISKNKDISADYATRQMNEQYRNTFPEAERLCKQLIGDVVEDSEGRYILSEKGAVWAEMSAAVQAQADGKDRFLANRYKHIELLPIIEARINSTIRRSMSGHDFRKAYEAMSADEKNLCQDMGDAIFTGKDGADWRHARAHIAADLKAAEAAVFVPLQEAVNVTVQNAWNYALPAFRAAANVFGRESWFFSEAQKGIYTQRVGMGYEVDRKAWGVHFANRSKVTHVEVSSPWPTNPQAKRGQS